jgi:hypothetical protein
VTFSVENAVFPGGEIAALRPEPPATAGQNLRDGLKAMGQLGVYPEFPPGFGILALEVEADHQYYLDRNAKGLLLKNFDDNPGLLDDGPLPNHTDFTSASPEVTADLLAMPQSDGVAQSNP